MSRIGENSHYRQQLLNALQCDDITLNQITNVGYKRKDLSKLFENYNKCSGGTEVVNYQKKNKRDLFNLRAKSGFGLGSLAITNAQRNTLNTEFDSEFIYRFGGELELILPFNNNKWAVVIEPSYQSYSSKKNYEIETTYIEPIAVSVEVSYSTIEIPLGLRYYFFLNDDSKIFLNAFYTFIFPQDSTIDYNVFSNLEIDKSARQSIGIGYSYKKFSIEGRYELSREVLKYYSF